MIKTKKGIRLLDDQQVRQIRYEGYVLNIPQRVTAERYGISQAAVSDIQTFKAYRDVT